MIDSIAQAIPLNESEQATPGFQLETIIGSGRYRTLYRISEDLGIKRINPIKKKKVGLVTMRINTQRYFSFLSGIQNINETEMANYRALIEQADGKLIESFGELIRLTEEGDLVVRIIRDYDKKISEPLSKHPMLKNDYFWEKISNIRDWFIKESIPYFNIHPKNILVKWTTDDQANPIFVDYKRMGHATYPFQPQLRFQSGIRRKLITQFERIMPKNHYN